MKDFGGAKGLAWIKITPDGITSPIAKFLSQEELDGILNRMDGEKGDLLLFVADKPSVVFDSLGNLRNEVARRLNILDDEELKMVWITEFPLFEYDEEEGRYVAKHHPFTHPMEEDIHLLETHPEKVRAKAYDIVINGDEIGGGEVLGLAIRIYRRKCLRLLDFQKKKLGINLDFYWKLLNMAHHLMVV